MFNSKKRVKDLMAPGAAAGGGGSANASAGSMSGLSGLGPTSAGNIQKLEMAKRLALKINAQKNLGAEAQVCVTYGEVISVPGKKKWRGPRHICKCIYLSSPPTLSTLTSLCTFYFFYVI